MAGQKREARLRARCPGHPRLTLRIRKDVDARHKAGHDGECRSRPFAISKLPLAQKRNCLLDRQIISHQPRMSCADNNMIGHAVELRVRD
jgi:hypothetical protein